MPAKTAQLAKRAPARRSAPEPVPTREIILDTAERLFAQRGVDGVAVRDLAREMNLTAPSLYNHFPGKQALYDAVLERGLNPIIEILAEAWHPGGLQPDRMRSTIDRLVTHLADHPHLAALLQRAMLDEGSGAEAILTRWFNVLYRGGVAVIKESASDAGWDPIELPHLAMALFGLVFAYFTNEKVLRRISKLAKDPLSADTLEVHRQFLQKAIYRLLGPQAPASAMSPV
ncbi:MAG TPA: TetR/AcrR family transcriptional regulator [Terriglobales bacterium]|nr:TetR/AcrR family transcriptional regulator [Terriglobales bacterium]